MNFPKRLARHREASGLSQSHLARLCECDHSTISRLESGGRFPSREMCMELARHLGLNTADRSRLLLSAGYVPDHVMRSEAMINALAVIIATIETERPVRIVEAA